MSIAENIAAVRDEVARAAIGAGRDPDEVTIVAISKTHSAEAVDEALVTGIRHFGENRVQEAAKKIPEVHGEAVWHLVGHLQSNKAGRAAGLFDWLDSVDSHKIADILQSHLAAEGGTLDVLIQVNISGEDVKSGVDPFVVPELAHHIDSLDTLRLRGLMTIGEFGAGESRRRDEFARMRRLFEDTRTTLETGDLFDVLSMGMSDDYTIAVAEGSTMVRIGTAIFGIR